MSASACQLLGELASTVSRRAYQTRRDRRNGGSQCAVRNGRRRARPIDLHRRLDGAFRVDQVRNRSISPGCACSLWVGGLDPGFSWSARREGRTNRGGRNRDRDFGLAKWPSDGWNKLGSCVTCSPSSRRRRIWMMFPYRSMAGTPASAADVWPRFWKRWLRPDWRERTQLVAAPAISCLDDPWVSAPGSLAKLIVR